MKRPIEFSGKSLISKEKAIQTAEKEELKLNPDPVFFMSFVGVNLEGFVEEHEHIFDIYTKEYDFLGCDVKVMSAQDLWDFYESKHKPVSTSVESGHKMSHRRKTFRDFFTSKKKLA